MNMLWLHPAGTVNIMEPISIKVIINYILQILWLGLEQPANGYVVCMYVYIYLFIYLISQLCFYIFFAFSKIN